MSYPTRKEYDEFLLGTIGFFCFVALTSDSMRSIVILCSYLSNCFGGDVKADTWYMIGKARIPELLGHTTTST